jgi:hypothetical protein
VGNRICVLIAMCMTSLALAQDRPEPNMVIEVTGSNLSRVDIQLLQKGMKEPIRYEFKTENGEIAGAIALAKEGDSQYEITAYDLEGKLTHIGTGSLGNYEQMDKGARLPLEPIDGSDGLVVEMARERLVLEVEPYKDSPEQISVSAQAFDPRGNVAHIQPGDLTWQLTDGRLIHLIPDREKPKVDMFPNKDSGIQELCSLEPKVVACRIGVQCQAIPVCFDPFVRVSSGHEHTCALTRDGFAFCWGNNNSGQLGAPTTTFCGSMAVMCNTRPLPVVCPQGAPCKFTQISTGVTITVAVDIFGDAWWWGRGSTTHHRVSAVLAGTAQKFSLVAAGYGHGCAISQSRSELWCWGTNGYGETGAPLLVPDVPDTAPVRVLAPAKFKRVSAGGEHTCAVGQTGTDVVCWGRNDSHQTRGLNNPTGFPHSTNGPFFFQQFGGLVSISDVATSGTSSCANMNIGVVCWGRHVGPQNSNLGWPDKITIGESHTCSLLNQQASCMGVGAWGQLGIGPMLSTTTPVAVVAPPSLYSDISAGDMHTCGITPNGDAFCWGNNFSGQLGNGEFNLMANRTPDRVER